MNLSIAELNELVYCMAAARLGIPPQLMETELAARLETRLRNELEKRINELVQAETDAVSKWG